MLLVMDTDTLPLPETVVRLARQLFPGQPIDASTLAHTLDWLQRCKQIAGESESENATTSATHNREKWFGGSRENGVALHTSDASEEQKTITETETEKGTFVLHDMQDSPIDIDEMMQSFRSYVKVNKLSANSLVKEIGASYISILNWLNGKAKPRGDSVTKIRRYMDRVTTT